MTALAEDVSALRAPTRRRRTAVVVTRFMAGAGGVALRGALCLPPEEFEPVIITGLADPVLARRAEEAGVHVEVLPSLVPEIDPKADFAALQELTRRFRADAYDVVHTHSAKAGTLGRLAAARAHTPRVVHTLHGFPFHEFQSKPRHAAYVGTERALSAVTDVFLAVGAGVAAEAVRRRIAPPDRLRTIAPTIDRLLTPADAATRERARRALGIPLDARVVGTVGRLDFQKAPERFLDAVALLPHVRALWVGGGPLREAAEEHARRLGIADRVLFTGSRDDVPDLLAAMDVFALSSRYEGLPCALAEAMSAGLPVVATAVNAVPDLVVPGETGLLVPPEQPAALARAVRHLLTSPVAAAAMAERGRAAVTQRFTAEALAPVLVEAYTGNPPIATRIPRARRPLSRTLR